MSVQHPEKTLIKKQPHLYNPRFQRASASYSHVIHRHLHSKPEQVKSVTKQLFAAALCRGLAHRQKCFPQLADSMIGRLNRWNTACEFINHPRIKKEAEASFLTTVLRDQCPPR
jgi:hypothetical protein